MSTGKFAWADHLRLDPDSPLPLYHQLREQLRTAVVGFAPGTPMPSEKELMTLVGVSRATVRKAVSDLMHEGVLRSKQGKHTFVAEARAETTLERAVGFTETMRRLGREPSTRVLHADLEEASGAVAERLRLDVGAPIAVIERLRLVDGRPAMLERAHLPAELVPGILDLDLEQSLYSLLEAHYHIRLTGGTELITAVNADAKLARLLDVPIASALLSTIRTTLTYDGVPAECTFRDARGDTCSFRVSLDSGSTLSDRSAIDELLAVS
jgi:GntR family transcriptional regulator